MKTSNIYLSAMPLVGLAMVAAFAAIAHGENSDEVQNPFVGTWELTSNWLKKDSEGKQVVTVNADLTGTVKDVENGWETKLRNVELKGDALSFNFYFEGVKDYEVDFKGTIAGEEIKGEYAVFGVKAIVTGAPMSAEEAAKIATRPSIYDIYEARSFTGSKNITLPYRLFVPENYDPKKKYPLILFHHGGGGTGENNRRNLEGELIREWILPEVQEKNPCFIVAPQFPGKESKTVQDGTFSMDEHTRTIHEILDSLEKEFSIDTSREYVTGLSFGGECTWMSLVERPDRFAAGVPICATDAYTKLTASNRTEAVAKLPLWIFHGDADEAVPVETSRKMVKAIKDAGGNPKYTEYPGVNHNSWTRTYRDPELVKWLFAQRLGADKDKRKSAEEAAKIAAQPSIRDIWEARSFTDSKNKTVQYQLFTPESYDPNKKYPLVLFHHGGGDNIMQYPGGELSKEWILPKVQEKNPCFIVSVQFPGKKAKSMPDGTFSMKGQFQAFHEVLDSLEKEFSIDKNREYVTGVSFGGECTWMSLVTRPDRFAAGVPICGTDGLTGVTVEERVEKVGKLPLWIFHGDADDVVPVDVSRNIVKALKDAGGNPKYTEYPGVNHEDCWRAYRDPELVKWLFAQRRGADKDKRKSAKDKKKHEPLNF